MRNVQTQPVTTVSQLLMIDQQPMMRFEDGDGHESAAAGGGEEAVVKATTTRPPVSRRSLRKILSRLHVDVWTAQHDAKFLDLLQRRTRGCGVGVGDLTADDWSAIRAELNAATGSAFPIEDLQRRLAELRREFDAVSLIKDHPRFTYDARRHVVVAKETEWKRYVLVRADSCCPLITRAARITTFTRIWSSSLSNDLDFRGGFRRTRMRWRTRGEARTSVASGRSSPAATQRRAGAAGPYAASRRGPRDA
jgi:hypothetical protein